MAGIIIPIIETSSATAGRIIREVNDKVKQLIDCLIKIEEDIGENVFFSPIIFSDDVKTVGLIDEKPVSVQEFVWRDLKSNGVANFGAALNFLYDKLTVEEKGGWMKCHGGTAPIIILISSGIPTDDYKSELEKLKKRGWFKAALKFAVGIGQEIDKTTLADFTTSEEAVLDANTGLAWEQIMGVIKYAMRPTPNFRPESCSCSDDTVAEPSSSSTDFTLIMDETDDLF